MKSVSKLGSVLFLVSSWFMVACSGAEPSDDGEVAEAGEISLAQRKSPSQGDSCTIERCGGTKDPFGKYTCDKNGVCGCVREGVNTTCDSNGENCKETGCAPSTASGSSKEGALEVDPGPTSVEETAPWHAPVEWSPSTVAP
jgi:hypothetical protein